MEAPGERSYRQVFRDRGLATLLAGDAVSKVGDGMLIVALPLQALRVHGGVDAALAIALVEAAPYVLSVLLAFTAGFGRRRFRPRRLLMADCVLRCGLFTTLGVLALTHTLGLWVLAVALLAGSPLRLLAVSSRRLVAAAMVGEESRFAVNGLLGTSDSLALYVLGPALGGLVATAAAPGVVLLAEGASFVALLVAVLVAVPAGTGGTTTAAGTPNASGWQILRRVPVAARLFAAVFLFNLFYGPVEVALPLLVRHNLHAPDAALGVIWTSFGVGALAGALATNRLRRLPREALLVGVIAGWGLSVAVVAVATHIAVAALAFAVGGVIYGPFTPVAYSVVQSSLRPEEQQPVITLWVAGATVAAPLGLSLGGPLVGVAGSRGGLAVSAALTLALVPVAAVSLRRSPPQADESGVGLGEVVT